MEKYSIEYRCPYSIKYKCPKCGSIWHELFGALAFECIFCKDGTMVEKVI